MQWYVEKAGLVMRICNDHSLLRHREAAVRDSGAAYTIVNAAWFARNFSESFLLEPVLGGEVAFPAGNVADPFVDVADIAGETA
jgi:uncharacterized protein YbjT (DUF2867 family)